MNKRAICEALYAIDEKFLAEYERTVQRQKKKKQAIRRIVPAAAGVMLIAVIGWSISRSGSLLVKPAGLTAEESEGEKNVVGAEVLGERTETGTEETKEKADSADSFGSGEETGLKGGETPEFLQKHSLAPDGVSYYEIFRPGTDSFEPLEEMTLEDRFCSFEYRGHAYTAAPNGELTEDDYEPEPIGAARASYRELRSPDAKIVGIEYSARMDLYRLKNLEPTEAVACVISFNGETTICRYNAVKSPEISRQPQLAASNGK